MNLSDYAGLEDRLSMLIAKATMPGERLPNTDRDIALLIQDSVTAEDSRVTYRPTGPSSGDWFVWNGVVHERVATDVDEYLATWYSDLFMAWHKSQAVPENVSPPTPARQAWQADASAVKRLRSHGGLTNLKQRLRAQFKVAPDHFNHDRDWIVMSSGWVYNSNDLRMSYPPSPDRPVTRHLAASFHALNEEATWTELLDWAERADSPRWESWLDEFVPDPEDQAFLQEAAGAALLGQGKARNIVNLVGPPATGKSTLLNVLSGVFGRRSESGYAGALNKDAIVKRNGSNFMQAEAKGIRFLTLSEPSTDRTDDSFLKNLSGGGEPIVTEQKNRDPDEWYAECVLHIASNSVLKFATWDEAVVERMNLVFFNTKVKRIDFNFEADLLAEESAGILAWVLEGAKRYLERGYIHVPECVRERGQANVIESSNVLRWLTEQETYSVTRDGSRTVSTCVLQSEAYSDYVGWAITSGEKPRSKAQFVDEVHKFTHLPEGKNVRSNGTRLFGVVLEPLTVRAGGRNVHL